MIYDDNHRKMKIENLQQGQWEMLTKIRIRQNNGEKEDNIGLKTSDYSHCLLGPGAVLLKCL